MNNLTIRDPNVLTTLTADLYDYGGGQPYYGEATKFYGEDVAP